MRSIPEPADREHELAAAGSRSADVTPPVTVVIPAHNAAGTIRRALSSVLAQTYPHVSEIIVVDDGSTDNTAGLVEAEFPRVRVIRQDRRGPSPARNRGVELASNELVASLDADDWWLPTRLAEQVPAMVADPALALVSCEADVRRPFLGRYRENSAPPQPPGPAPLEYREFRDWFTARGPASLPGAPSGWLFRREAYLGVGAMSGKWPVMGDLEFILRLAASGARTAVVRRPLFVYYVRYDSVCNSAAGRVRVARMLPQLLALYDPGQASGHTGLLSQEEYETTLRRDHINAGKSLWCQGMTHEARGQFAHAATYLRGANTGERARLWLLQKAPSLVLTPRRVAFRIMRLLRTGSLRLS